MKEVAGALIAIVLVLSAVFTPVAFLGASRANCTDNLPSRLL